jgi:hypothetical protein
MATTFLRIFTAITQASQNNKWEDKEQLANKIREKKLKEFKVRGDGSSIDHYMKENSIAQLLDLMIELELLEKNIDEKLRLTRKGKKCVKSVEKLKPLMRSSVKSLLEHRKLPFDVIKGEINKIKLPEVPDADNIFEHLKKVNHGVSRELLRKLLFLYACADGIKRKMHVHYEIQP